MKMNKRRTWTAFLGIFFMVLLMTCVFAGKETAIRYLQDAGSQVKGKWHVNVYDVTKEDEQVVQELGYVKETGRSVDYGFTEFPGSANPQRPCLYVKAYEEPCFDWMNIELKEGRLPRKKGEFVISRSAADDGAVLTVGDTVRAEYFERTVTGIKEGVTTTFPFFDLQLTFGETKKVSQNFPFYEDNDSFRVDKSFTGKNEELTLVGIVETPWFEQEGAAGYLAFTCYDDAWSGAYNLAGIMDLKAVKGDMYQDFREAVGDREIEFNDYVLSFSGDSSDSVVNFIVRVMTVFFLAVVVTSAVILIYNVFNLSFEERSRYLGMLCSVGATGKQKRSSVYFEAFVLFLPALPLGILAGFLVVLLGMHLLLPFIYSLMSVLSVLPERLPVHLTVSWKTLFLIAAGSGATVLLSAVLLAWKISKVGPIASVRGNLEKDFSGYRRRKKTYFHKTAEEMLAKNTLRYQKRKTRGMIRAAVIFMTVLIVVAASTQTATKLINYRMLDTNIVNVNSDGWDYCLTEYRGKLEEYREIKKEIMAGEGVKEVREEYTGMFAGNIPGEVLGREYWDALHRVYDLYYHRELSEEEFQDMFSDGTQVICFIAVDEETYESIAEVTDTDMELLRDTKVPSAIVVQSGEVSTENWRVYGREAEKYEFHEIEQKLSVLTESENSGFILGKGKRGKTLPEAINSIIRILMLCFVVLTSVICLLNLYNSVHGWIIEQRPYFAMLVSVGMTQSQIRRMLFYEAGHILAVSCLWTAAISTSLILGIKRCLIERFGHVRADFPWQLYLAAVFAAVIVIFGFMLYHYRREKDYELRTVLMV